VLAEQFVGSESTSTEWAHCRLGRNAKMRAQMDSEIVLVLVGACTEVTLEGAGRCVYRKMFMVLGLEKERLEAVVTSVDLLLLRPS